MFRSASSETEKKRVILKMKHHENSLKIKDMSRRKFLMGSIAAGALALGGVLSGNRDLLAESMDRLGGSHWEVTIDGKMVKKGTGFSNEKEELIIPVENGTARIVFEQGRIYMPDDNHICTKKICSLMGAISKSGESITCLPNKLVIRII